MGGGPPLTSLGFTDAWKILQKLGFSHSTSGYRFPGVRGRDGILGFNKFEHDHSLQEHLARFGLPDNCVFENLGTGERLGLELFLAESPYVETYYYGSTYRTI